ncbi:hypothetical protein [Actinomyces succiniciruminis]|uniref:Uncharacterized protein n=1 Tax=Actinomyces succiniciruminis TaxID=1522002 RepID=A0A1L7RLV5_9ACTO|nr:hypothetical protein [Actinomyces succiniciruminis]CED90264.1 Hypothetical protein AAM4_0369 [Actinomyces succiniciruminis]
MAIQPSELGVADQTLARRVLAHAQVIAPCLHSLDDAARLDALAILQGVAAEAQARGLRSVASQSVGTARVTYGSAASWFTDDDRAALRALCAQASRSSVASSGHPVGSFPAPSRDLRAIWPERED